MRERKNAQKIYNAYYIKTESERQTKWRAEYAKEEEKKKEDENGSSVDFVVVRLCFGIVFKLTAQRMREL